MNKRRSLGQHFLISDLVAKSIVNFANITKDDIVVEVGTGRGILIPYLCEKAKKVISVEKDRELYFQAKKKFSGIQNLVLEYGDAFKINHKFTIFVSNLPYSKSRKAIEWLIQRKFSHAVIMVQKEFAQKLVAETGSKDIRAISVLASYCMDIRNLTNIKKSNFSPPPQVDSVVLGLTQKHQLSDKIIRDVNKIFSFKRKTLRNIGKQLGIAIDSDNRLEDLPHNEIIEIAKKISK
jgi:16S rRNA (adenine1518-N6/adenine1519-N6)-dimethyltransferase